jgi:hypothetical protein
MSPIYASRKYKKTTFLTKMMSKKGKITLLIKITNLTHKNRGNAARIVNQENFLFSKKFRIKLS